MRSMEGKLRLGGVLDAGTGERTGAPAAIASADLTTHGVIVGMTGSGKTGLGIVLVEEALSSGVPALILDPKGDMGNLLLNFPALRPSDFRPWIDESDVLRRGEEPDVAAAATAARWKEGLASWDLGPADMRALGLGAAFTIYTPGSTAGVPLNVLGSLRSPLAAGAAPDEAVRDEIEGFVTSLLGLAGIDADPLSSAEHVLLSNLIDRAWSAGRDLDLATLIAQVADPPIRKLGVFDIDAFFPPKDRQQLALRLNALLASPSFAEWLAGPPLDIESMLRAPDGRPRAAVLYLAHLSDAERQFVVTLALSKLVTWMRGQPGTSELRTLVYMDEVYGFAPPTAAPPSKKPILTILKQARAHGVGMVLSTQNPVDLDYKAMSNAGTWMVGRLQTERDKARVIEALKSASGDVDVGAWDARIGSLGKRQFLLRSAGRAAPTLFATRWAMSYLRGPLTKAEIGRLMADAPERDVDGAGAAPTATARAAGSGSAAPSPVSDDSAAPAQLGPDETPAPPAVPGSARVQYVDPAAPWTAQLGVEAGSTRLEAALAVRVHLRFDETRAGVDAREEWEAIYHPLGEHFDAESAVAVDYDDRDFRDAAPTGAVYALPRAPIGESRWWRDAERSIVDALHRGRTTTVLRNEELKLYSRVGESEEDFRARCTAAADDAADADAAKLRDRFEAKRKRVADRMADLERRGRELEVDVSQRKQQELIAGAGELLSMFLGGRRRTRSLSGFASRRSQTVRTRERLRTSQERQEDLEAELDAIEEELGAELAAIQERWDAAAERIESLDIGLEKNDIQVERLALLWIPMRR